MAEEKTVTTTAAETGENRRRQRAQCRRSRKLRQGPITRHMWTT